MKTPNPAPGATLEQTISGLRIIYRVMLVPPILLGTLILAMPDLADGLLEELVFESLALTLGLGAAGTTAFCLLLAVILPRVFVRRMQEEKMNLAQKIQVYRGIAIMKAGLFEAPALLWAVFGLLLKNPYFLVGTAVFSVFNLISTPTLEQAEEVLGEKAGGSDTLYKSK